jgi:hypothetical protein
MLRKFGAAMALGVLVTGTAWCAVPRGPQPVVRIPLENIGFPGYSANLMQIGPSVLTVNFADATHLLVTYSLRGLVERAEDDDPNEQPRAVGGLLVELPSGKVVARTRWHMHDYAQYLWPLGDGRFLVRIGRKLLAIAPAANLASGNAFHETLFLEPKQPIDLVVVSTDGKLVTVESSPRKRVRPAQPVLTPRVPATQTAADPAASSSSGPGTAAANADADTEEEPAVPARRVETFDFLRVTGAGTPASPVHAVLAGSALVGNMARLPLSSEGYLYATREVKSTWRMKFESFDGEVRPLSTVESSCPPHLQFVGPAQFLTFTCRGADDRLMLSSFDFVPVERWEDPMRGNNAFVHFAYAPEAGRFLISRVISILQMPPGGASMTALGAVDTVQEQLTQQEVRVYQTASGDMPFRMNADPVSRTGQNFDISADGMSVLVVRGGAIEIYALPPLGAADRKELAEVNALRPPEQKNDRVVLAQLLKRAGGKPSQEEETDEAAPVAAKASAASAAAAATVPPVTTPAATPTPVAPTATQGDDNAPRKPPSLLNPGEKPDKP